MALMMYTVRCLLAAVCSMLLVCPPGWCCYLGLVPCCSGTSQTKETPSKARCGGCCSSKSESPAPAAKYCCSGKPADATPQKSAPGPKPGPPAPNCCYDRLPATPANTQSQLPELSATFVHRPIADLQVAGSQCFGAAAQDIPISASPLNLLHCLWLC
jgi:hypothetical protein